MSRGLVIYPEDRRSFDLLTMVERGRLITAMFDEHEGTAPTTIKGKRIELIWTQLQPKVEINKSKYAAIVERNRSNAKKGGRGKAEINPTGSEINPMGSEIKPTRTRTRTGTGTDIPPTPKGGVDGWFEEVFWKAYPRKTAKKKAHEAARKVWTEEDADEIMAGLERAKDSDQWRRDGGRFIPHAATWLNQERWTDEEEPSAAVTTDDERAPRHNEPELHCGLPPPGWDD